MRGALSGITVLDLSWILAGPFCTMVLADLGARVIKVERPGYGDLARGTGPFLDGESAYFLSLNRGKKSLTLNLRSDRGKEIFLALVKRVDVLVENFVPGTMRKLGLDYPVLREHNPGLIYTAISGFGQTGPYAGRPALDIIVQGMGGIMSLTGEPGGGPVRPGASLGDMVAGLFAAIGILAALEERRQSGLGQMLDIGMLDCQVTLLENAFARYFATGETPVALGTRHPVFTPFQAFQTKDGYMVVAIVGGANDQWPLFCATIGHLELMDDPRFRDGWLRTQHYGELEPILKEAFQQKTTAAWLEELGAVGIACGPVNTIPQVAQDPQVRERGMFVEVSHPTLGRVPVVNTPFKFSRSPSGPQGLSPALGADTEAVLGELLGLPAEEVAQLRAAGVV